MPEWVGTVLFLGAAVLAGSKIAHDFGDKGLRGYAMLLLVFAILAAAIGVAFV
jgi:hypothetical protein